MSTTNRELMARPPEIEILRTSHCGRGRESKVKVKKLPSFKFPAFIVAYLMILSTDKLYASRGCI